jgi:NADP-dependent 3-hydroxy acid dehydrogenase YdfG
MAESRGVRPHSGELIRHGREVFGYIDLTRIIYPHMCKRGSGVIVNIVGTAARNPSDA